MIQEESYLKVADNTGAKDAEDHPRPGWFPAVSMATSVMWSWLPSARLHPAAR